MTEVTPKLTDEMREALKRNGGGPVEVEDDQTHRVYVIVDEDLHRRSMQALQMQDDMGAIQAGFDAAAEGRVAPLEEVDARIREKLGFPPAQ